MPLLKCLHVLVGREEEKYLSFRHRHYKKCNNPSWYFVSLYDTGIGEGITVKCPVCGQSEEITDADAW